VLAGLVLAALLVWGCGSSNGPAVPKGTLALGPQESCDRDLAKSPPDVTVYGADAGDYLGDRFSLATGDFNGDGRSDVLVGAPLADGAGNRRSDAGEAYVLFGSSQPPPTIDLAEGGPFTVIGENAGDNLGFTVAAGDVNGDGRDDVIVGARFAQAGGQPAVGKAYVFFGRPDIGGAFDMASGTADVTIIGENTGDFTSIALATGDVNGDKIADILLGASGSNGEKGDRRGAGKVEVVLGSKNLAGQIDLRQKPPFLTVYGANAGDTVPNHLAAGDLDDDKRAELIIGAPFVDAENREDAGRVYIVHVPDKSGTIDLASAGDVGQLTGRARKDAMGLRWRLRT